MKTIEVRLNQKHLDNGCQVSPRNCAVSLAIQEALPVVDFCLVSYKTISLWDIFDNRFEVFVNDETRKIIAQFDQNRGRGLLRHKFLFWKKRDYLVFEIQVPDQLLPCEPKRDLSARVNAPSESVLPKKEENHVLA